MYLVILPGAGGLCLQCVNSKSELTGFTSEPDVTFADHNLYQTQWQHFLRLTRRDEAGIFSKLLVGSNSWK